MFNMAMSYMSDDSSDDWLTDDDCNVDEFERSRILSLPKKDRKEARMQKIETEISMLEDQVDNVRMELEFRKDAGQEAADSHSVVLMQFKEKMDKLKWALNTKMVSETRRRSSLGSYVTTMRNVAGPGSMYVQSIQGQACRAVHIVAVQKRQRDMMNHHAKSLCAYVQQQVVQMESEHADLTKNILTRHYELGCEKRELAKSYNRLLKSQEASLDGQRFTESLKTTGLTASLAVEEASLTHRRTSRRPTRRASLSHSESLPTEQAPNEIPLQLASSEEAVEIKESTEQVVAQPHTRMKKRRSSLGGFVTNPFSQQAVERRRSRKSSTVGEAGIELRELSSSARGENASAGDGMFAAAAAMVQAMDLNDDSSQLAESRDTKEGWEGKNNKGATQVC